MPPPPPPQFQLRGPVRSDTPLGLRPASYLPLPQVGGPWGCGWWVCRGGLLPVQGPPVWETL